MLHRSDLDIIETSFLVNPSSPRNILLAKGIRYSVLLLCPLIAFFCLSACDMRSVGSRPVSALTTTSSCVPKYMSKNLLSIEKQKIYDEAALQYFWFAVHQRYQLMYSMLSDSLRRKEPYTEFITDPNYVLSSGCWEIYQIAVSQQAEDEQSWIIGIEIEFHSNSNNNTIWYYWIIHLRKERNRPVFVQFGLYPTGINY